MALKSMLRKIIPVSVWNAGHYLMALAGAIFYRFPSRGMVIIGVTGTNGKSTVVELLHQVFSDFGLRVSSLSTLRFKILNARQENLMKMTMPGRFFLQRFLKEARNRGSQVVILEVTSEGIKQYRHIGINFDTAVLTNLRPEHIESHGSFEAYRAAKGKLFKNLAWHKPGSKSVSVVNLDDPSAFFYVNFKSDKKFGFGLLKENVRPGIKAIIPEDIRFGKNGISFSYGDIKWKSPLVGDFNLYNVLAAIAVARSFKIPLEDVKKSIQKVKGIPGRLEVVQEKPFRVIVDYAHTPDALEGIYRTIRSLWLGPKAKLIGVLGSAGGGRDHWKRLELGRAADRFCDRVILTNEDPYKEDPVSILHDIERGISQTKHELIIDRREAIARALALAKENDAVVITGKGAEKMIMTAAGPVTWDDRRVVKEELKKKDSDPKSKK